MNTYELASALLEIVPTSFRYRREDAVLIGEGEWRELPTDIPQLWPIRDEASLIVRELDTALRHNNWRPDRNFFAFPDVGHWSLGSVEQRAPIRKIHLGYVEPVRRFPVLERVPELVVAFLTKIPGWNDYVKREYHPGVGWHYHYLADPRKRSDVLMAWDTRWQAPAKASDGLPPPRHPLFGEKHGEGKADFSAKPWLWGDKKKESMHDVCSPDLKKWPIHEFRCASNHAEPVWPSRAKLTSMHLPVSPPASLSEKRSSAADVAAAPLLGPAGKACEGRWHFVSFTNTLRRRATSRRNGELANEPTRNCSRRDRPGRRGSAGEQWP